MDDKNYAKERIENDFAPSLPGDDIRCRTCLFRKADLVIAGKTIVKGYKNGYCDMYPDGKPNDILFRKSDCEYHVKG